MEVDALLNIAQAAIRGLEVWVSLERISKDKLEDNFHVRADDRVAENAKQGNALSTRVLSVVCRDQVAELLVYFLELFLGDLRSWLLATSFHKVLLEIRVICYLSVHIQNIISI